LQKAQGKFVGGRRTFGYQIVDGRKQEREREQRIISEMQLLRSAGNSYRFIASWLASNADVQLTLTGVRWVLQPSELSARGEDSASPRRVYSVIACATSPFIKRR
jgi:hypothetical protein